MKRSTLIFYLGFLALTFALIAVPASAATLFLSPKTGSFGVGQTFDLEVKIDSEGQGFNAAQATIQFSKDILGIKSLDFSPSATVFNFWLQEPKVSESDGKIFFIGGATNGIIGASVSVLKVTFVARGSGEGSVGISDAAITASDGSGTNILSTVAGAKFRVEPTVVLPTLATSSVSQPPVQIRRTPVPVQKLPEKPKIVIPLYPDSAKWYNISTEFIVQWDLPLDVSAVSTMLDKNSASLFSPESEGLFDAEIFPALKDGIWYLHVRFKNNIGWGPVAHYRLAIDTVPPLQFSIESSDGQNTDNPTPTLRFGTSDGLSGIDHYILRVGDGDAFNTAEKTIILQSQAPGEHAVSVKAVDGAGNIREGTLTLKILPIVAPTIVNISKMLFVGEGGFQASGQSLPNANILFSVKNALGKTVHSGTVSSDSAGLWGIQTDEPFSKGRYQLQVISRDARGALSLPTLSDLVRVKERPLFAFSGIEITKTWFFVGIVIILLIGIGAGVYLEKIRKGQRRRRIIIAARDIINLSELIRDDLDRAFALCVEAKTGHKTKDGINKLITKRIADNLEKLKKYVVPNVEDIEK